MTPKPRERASPRSSDASTRRTPPRTRLGRRLRKGKVPSLIQGRCRASHSGKGAESPSKVPSLHLAFWSDESRSWSTAASAAARWFDERRDVFVEGALVACVAAGVVVALGNAAPKITTAMWRRESTPNRARLSRMCSSDGNRTRETKRPTAKDFDAWSSTRRRRSATPRASRVWRNSPRRADRRAEPDARAVRRRARRNQGSASVAKRSTLDQVDDATSHLAIPSRSGRGAIRRERKEKRTTRAAGVALYVKLARRSSATSPNARDILGVTCRTVANEALAIVRRVRATAL